MEGHVFRSACLQDGISIRMMCLAGVHVLQDRSYLRISLIGGHVLQDGILTGSFVLQEDTSYRRTGLINVYVL